MKMAKFNMQQQPKTPGYLSALKARPGYKLVQFDLAAIEPRIVTEFSRDPTMMNLYGSNAKQNDIYLYNGAHISLFSDEIRKTYDPANPTPESIAATKKRCKRLRDFNKSITLASGYGCGVHKLRSILITGGFPVTEAEAKQIHTDYWKLYAGIKVFGAELERLWAANGGWFPNVSGRPICVPFDLLHDSVNRFAQSSGHDVLMFFIYHTQRLRKERGVEMYPWIVDFHDEQIWEVPEAQVDAAKQVLIDALTAVNVELAMGVQITGEPEVVDNLAEIKCPEEYKAWREAQCNALATCA